MGAYLNKPIVEKVREEGKGNGFQYACTSMQGWRANQEDAHNCVVGIHDDWNMFAVYDGHGGSEVSKYTADKLPAFLKERKFWDEKEIEECLQKAFVDFDDFLRSETAMKDLNIIANPEKGKKEDGDSEDEADRIETIEESGIPLQEIMKRYGINIGNLGGTRKSLVNALVRNGEAEENDESDEDEDEEENEEEEKEDEKGENAAEEPEKEKKVKKRCSKSPIQISPKKSKTEDDKPEKKEGEEAAKSSDDANPTGSSSQEKTEKVEEDSDDDDKDFVAEDDEEAEDEELDDEDEEEGEEPDFRNMIIGGGGETPGEDSGTTACVCLLNKDHIIVANAGDSRAVLCRAGKAVDLSVDHKPEDEVETARIHKAGGVIEDGRVNGGLNLSRAFGDHTYKKNEALSLKEQMISAFPDIKIEKLTPEDEFLIVACDGIWNSMESQQVIDFVRAKLAEGKTCTEVCDELCEACLADSTDGDGTGCDNMTVICTQFVKQD